MIKPHPDWIKTLTALEEEMTRTKPTGHLRDAVTKVRLAKMRVEQHAKDVETAEKAAAEAKDAELAAAMAIVEGTEKAATPAQPVAKPEKK